MSGGSALQVRERPLEEALLLDPAKDAIADRAEQAADTPRLVVMVDVQMTLAGRSSTESADPTLGFQQRIVLRLGDAVVAPKVRILRVFGMPRVPFPQFGCG